MINSLKHPNGFTAFHITDNIRVHHWDDVNINQPSDCHKHRWDYSGMVVTGSLKIEYFKEISDGSIEKYHWCGDNELVYMGNCGLVPVSIEIVTGYHSGVQTTIHRVTALEPTVTIFEHGPVVGAAIVYKEQV